jgi:hypothetical protein
MIVTIIQGLLKEGSKKKKNYCESACGHRAVKVRQQEKKIIVKMLMTT